MTDIKGMKYVSDNAQLMSEWDWEKNNLLGFYPDKLTFCSNKKVWWICEKQHSWEHHKFEVFTKGIKRNYAYNN